MKILQFEEVLQTLTSLQSSKTSLEQGLLRSIMVREAISSTDDPVRLDMRVMGLTNMPQITDEMMMVVSSDTEISSCQRIKKEDLIPADIFSISKRHAIIFLNLWEEDCRENLAQMDQKIKENINLLHSLSHG